MKYKVIGFCVLGGGILVILATLFVHLHKRVGNIQGYNSFLNEERNGCISTKEITGVNVTIKYQPPLYMTLKETEQLKANEIQPSWDSIYKKQTCMTTFLMTIGPDKLKRKDKRHSIMYEGVNDYAEYTQRVLSTNFNMVQQIRLYVNGEERIPVLSLLENVYELSEDRSFVIVFVNNGMKSMKGNDYIFVYDDPFFNIGKVQFHFKGDDLEDANNVIVKR
ncbi:MAG: hypothetical protein P4L41_02810 [Flavipsychrobacter sp.]|nr:hypothetical protein [Flavipsychrobacter sp.]